MMKAKLSELWDKGVDLALVLVGVVMLVVGIALKLTNHNAYLLLCTLLVVGGTVAYVRRLKKQSRY